MSYIKTFEELIDMPDSYKQVFQNKFTANIDKDKIVSEKYEGNITDRDVEIVKFLFTCRFATAHQVYEYLRVKNIIDENASESSIKIRMDKLISLYRVLNKFMLSSYEAESIESDALEIYCLDLGGKFLLHNFSSEPLEDIRGWRPRTANLKMPHSIFKDLYIATFYTKLVDIFGSKLSFFNAYKKVMCDKEPMTFTFDFGVDNDGEIKYFIGQIVREAELISKFGEQADKIESLVSGFGWKKYYAETETPPMIFFITDDDYNANEVAQSVALRQISRYRLTTLERAMGDLSTAFMSYDPASATLKLGRSSLFVKK